jgi:hypothetical protein
LSLEGDNVCEVNWNSSAGGHEARKKSREGKQESGKRNDAKEKARAKRERKALPKPQQQKEKK